jgi:hypothetical protein
MNYTYELKYEIGLKKEMMFFVYESENGIKSRVSSIDYREIIIIELLNDEFQESWYLNFLKNSKNDFLALHLRDSFQRTKNWVLQKHPELLL